MKQVKERAVRFARKRRAAFTLTEMLMAAGILGIGLTMVASIFPVAVDQSRRSSDQTHAALCARSVAAALRLKRADIVKYIRNKQYLQEIAGSTLPDELRVYKPNAFLADGSYTDLPLWNAGNYVARVWLFTEMTTGGVAKPSMPWRAVIVVCKSIGATPPDKWSATWNLDRPERDRMRPGAYWVEWRYTGYAYMADYIEYPASQPVGYLAVGKQATVDTNIVLGTSYCFPDAIAAYSTIVGD